MNTQHLLVGADNEDVPAASDLQQPLDFGTSDAVGAAATATATATATDVDVDVDVDVDATAVAVRPGRRRVKCVPEPITPVRLVFARRIFTTAPGVHLTWEALNVGMEER